MAEEPTTTAHRHSADLEPPRLSAWRQATLSLYWFATQAQWTAILMILLPKQAVLIGGTAHKGTTLGMILLLGALVSMVVAPFFGAWSDRVRTRWGRRKPFIVVGTLGNVLGLLLFAAIPAAPSTLIPYILAFVWLELCNNLATAPYSALIPDVVPAAQRGSASGWMGLMMMLGNFAGGACGLALGAVGGFSGVYLLLAGVMLLGMLGTVLCVRESDPPATPPFDLRAFGRGLIAPFAAADFRWVFLTRFLVMLGVFTVQEFLQYYLHDVIAGGRGIFNFQAFGYTLARNAEGATTFFVLMLLIGAIVSTWFAGSLSDRYGRKRMVYLSGALQGAAAIVMLFAGHFQTALLLGLVFGFGYGAYQAVDWALVTDVLPNAEDHAKDMGLWHIAVTLPQVTAAPIAGVLLDTGQRYGGQHGIVHLGYLIIFSARVHLLSARYRAGAEDQTGAVGLGEPRYTRNEWGMAGRPHGIAPSARTCWTCAVLMGYS